MWASERRKGWGKPLTGNPPDDGLASMPIKIREKGGDVASGGGRRSPLKKNGKNEKEEKGGDGIGRLDA